MTAGTMYATPLSTPTKPALAFLDRRRKSLPSGSASVLPQWQYKYSQPRLNVVTNVTFQTESQAQPQGQRAYLPTPPHHPYYPHSHASQNQTPTKAQQPPTRSDSGFEECEPKQTRYIVTRSAKYISNENPGLHPYQQSSTVEEQPSFPAEQKTVRSFPAYLPTPPTFQPSRVSQLLVSYTIHTLPSLLPSYRSVEANPSVPNQAQVSGEEMAHSLSRYILPSLLRTTSVSELHLLMALVYIKRFTQTLPPNCVCNPDTPVRLMLASLLLSSKYWYGEGNSSHYDLPLHRFNIQLPSKRHAGVGVRDLCRVTRYGAREIVKMEREFLRVMGWKCTVSPDEVREFWEKDILGSKDDCMEEDEDEAEQDEEMPKLECECDSSCQCGENKENAQVQNENAVNGSVPINEENSQTEEEMDNVDLEDDEEDESIHGDDVEEWDLQMMASRLVLI